MRVRPVLPLLLLLQVAAVYHGMLDEALMKVLHGQEKKVLVWTVDSAADMAQMLHFGVDGIVTNAPGLLQATLQGILMECAKRTR